MEMTHLLTGRGFPELNIVVPSFLFRISFYVDLKTILRLTLL